MTWCCRSYGRRHAWYADDIRHGSRVPQPHPITYLSARRTTHIVPLAAQGEDVDGTAHGAEDAADLTALQENLDNKGQNAYYCKTYATSPTPGQAPHCCCYLLLLSPPPSKS